MKIAVRKISLMQGGQYGDAYGEGFFDDLWKEHLLSHLSSDDKVVWYEHMPVKPDEFDTLLGNYNAVIGAWIMQDMITDEIISRHPNLRYIGTISHGYVPFEKEICVKNNLTITNTIFNDDSVAQHVFALLLEICNNVGINNSFYKKDKWVSENPDKNKLHTKQLCLTGKTMGIIGYGNIGYKVAEIADGFGMRILANNRKLKPFGNEDNVVMATFEDVIRESDVISIHCPLSSTTKNMINANVISKMKDNVIIINTSRGEIIDEDALNDALNRRKVYAAGLDVFRNEPLKKPSKLLNNEYVIATEHIAWESIESRVKSIVVACQNFFNWRKGTPTSVIS